jgi:hypothetical protein
MHYLPVVVLVLVSLFASAYGTCPSVPSGGCSVCGEGKCVSQPDAIVQIGSDTPYTCGDLQQLGYTGKVTSFGCQNFPFLLADVCKCDVTTPGPVTPAPTTATPAPAKPTKTVTGGKKPKTKNAAPTTKKAGKKRALREAADTARGI